jgi:4-amino-4-deoxy-L-arabinose transferase-like glycosyltransferase
VSRCRRWAAPRAARNVKRKGANWCWVLFGLALALRIGWVTVSWNREGVIPRYPDEVLHWDLASNLVEHGQMVSKLGPEGLSAPRMPGYPLFLSAFAWMGEPAVLAARIAQAVVGAATVLVAYWVANRAFGRRAAIGAGVLVCCDPFNVFFANMLLTEAIFTPILVGLTACAYQAIAKPERWCGVVGVAVLGAGTIMVRPSAAALVPLLWLLVLCLSSNRSRAFARLLICPLALAGVMLPWGLRNKAAIGSYAWLSTNGGITLYDAQGPQATGASDQAFLTTLLEDPAFAELGEAERDRALARLAVRQMRENPPRVAQLAAVKLRRMWNPFPNVEEHSSGPAAWAGAAYTVVVVLGTFAAVGLARRHQPGADRRRLALLLLWTPIVYFTLLHCVYIGSLRYRVPLMPLMATAAAGVVVARSSSVARGEV